MGASYVVTSDRDLLEPMDPTSAAGQDFRGRFPAIRFLKPADFQATIAGDAADRA